MKCQILFSGKNKKNISICHLLKILPRVLSIKVLITITPNDTLKLFIFSEKIQLNISCESSAWQMIHMKCCLIFSEKEKEMKKMSSAAGVISALEVNLNKSNHYNKTIHNI